MSGVPGGVGDAAGAAHGWAQWLTGVAGVAGGATVVGAEWGPGALTAGVGELARRAGRTMTPPYDVHPSAYIDEPCTIGAGTQIWHFCHVMAGARIGERCILGQNVHVASD